MPHLSPGVRNFFPSGIHHFISDQKLAKSNHRAEIQSHSDETTTTRFMKTLFSACLSSIFLALFFIGCSPTVDSMNDLKAEDPWVIRTDFGEDAKWQQACKLISLPTREIGQEFFAHVVFKEDRKFANLSPVEIVHSLPDNYPGYLCFVVDKATLGSKEFPILVIDFAPDSLDPKDYERPPSQTPVTEIKSFRAIPSTIQSIENNLTIANMDFEDFADHAGPDGVFRGFVE